MYVKFEGQHFTFSLNFFYRDRCSDILKKKILVHVPKSDVRSAQINTSTLMEKYDLNLFKTVHFLTQQPLCSVPALTMFIKHLIKVLIVL